MARDRDTPPRRDEPGKVLSEIVDLAAEGAAASGAPGTAILRRGSALGRKLYRMRSRPVGLWIVLAGLGPGLITANAGNDAGGIATYSSVGAQYGYSLLWMFPLILVALAVIQEMCARMGAATGKGLSDLIRENFSIHATAFVLLALLVANGGTVVSEFVGIAASIEIIFPPGSQYVGVPLIALILWLVVIRGSYNSVEKIFLVLTLPFLAYPISAVLAHPDWGAAARHTIVPTVQFNQRYLLMFVATVGTSITPYMQVYVQSAVRDKGITPRDYTPERNEVYLASVFANLIAVFVVIATAATLWAHHQYTVNTAADAAQALGPLAGKNAKYLFTAGLFGASMLAAAVLPLATAYSITEALGLENSLDRSFREAPVFKGLFTGLIVLGVAVALVIPGEALIQALIYVQDIDCLLLPIILFAILRLINNRKLMGDMVNGPVYNFIARFSAVVISLMSVILVITTTLTIVGVNVGS